MKAPQRAAAAGVRANRGGELAKDVERAIPGLVLSSIRHSTHIVRTTSERNAVVEFRAGLKHIGDDDGPSCPPRRFCTEKKIARGKKKN